MNRYAVQTVEGLNPKPLTFLEGFRAIQQAYTKTKIPHRVALIQFPSQLEVAYIEANTHWSEVQFVGLTAAESADKCNELWAGIKAYSDKGLSC